MKKLIYEAIHRRALMFVLFGLLAVIGYYAWTRLAIDAYPDIADVTVQVVTQVPGLAAEEIEQQISIPIERAMNGLPGPACDAEQKYVRPIDRDPRVSGRGGRLLGPAARAGGGWWTWNFPTMPFRA